MQKAVYLRPGTFEAREADRPGPGAGEVVVEVAFTGVCGTDLHIAHGDMAARVAPGTVIGHEMSGRIASLGAHVTGWTVGDPVTVMPLTWCGHCAACRSGYHHICHELTFLGIDADGSMQQFWAVPAANLVALPATLVLRDAALVEPTAVAVHDVGRAGVRPGDQVVVVGGGPVGLLIAVVAVRTGADVVVVEPDARRREVARSAGLRVLDSAEDVPGWVQDWTGGAGAVVAFEVSGAEAGLSTAVDVLAARGRLCLVAIHATPRPVNLHRFFWRELTLVGARLYERADFERAVQLLRDGAIPADAMISRVVALGDVSSAFDALASGGHVKVLVDCRTALRSAAP